MSKLKIRNTDNTFSEVATVDYVDEKITEAGAGVTYSLSKTGSTIKLTGSDGSTSTVTDSNTTYSTGNASSAGLTKLYTGTGTNTDGSMTQNAIKSALDGKVPTTRTVNGKALSSNITLGAADVGADASGAANTALTNAKSYTDTQIAALINSAPTTLDTLGEIASAMSDNMEVVEALEASIGNKADKSAIPTKTSQLTNDSGFKTTDNNTTYTISKSGSTITLTGSDGKTSTVTDSDTNTTYSEATTSAAGLMSAADKTKLNGIATGANKITVDTALSSTSTNPVQNKVINTALAGKANTSAIPTKTSQLTNDSGFKTTDNNTTYSLSKSGSTITLTGSDGSTTSVTDADTNTTYSAATTSANGLMTSTMVTKLNGIATGANNYSHPTTSGNKHIPSGGSSGQILRWSADGTATWGADNNTTYSAATTSANGLMTSAMVTKLNGIAAGAQVNNVVVATSAPTASTAQVWINPNGQTSISNLQSQIDALSAKLPTTIFDGTLQGGQSVTLSGVKRYIEVHFAIEFGMIQTGVAILDTAETSADNVFGSVVWSPMDESTINSFYVCECYYQKSTKKLYHKRTGYIGFPSGSWTDRNARDGYRVYLVRTYD